MTETVPQEPAEALNSDTPDTPTPDVPKDAEQDVEPAQEDAETFPRAYVEKLRDENKRYRQHAADRDALAERLHTALVTATGRLADATDLPYDEAHLTDEGALSAALDDLLTRKPHLAPRRPRGDVGQGATTNTETVDLAAMLRSRA